MSNDIERMKQEVEEYRKERVAQGLPAVKPSRPRGIVSEQSARALLARCKPLVESLKEYVRLCDASNLINDISQEQEAWLDSFTETLTLLEYADDKTAFAEMYKGQAIGWLVSMIKNRAKYEEADDYITNLFIILKFINDEPHQFNRNTEINPEEYKAILEELSERKEEFDAWQDS